MANVVTKHSISSELAQKMVDEAMAKARQLGVAENVAILDDGGNLKAFGRMDGAPILCLVLRHLNAKDRGSIHPTECLEIAAVIENRYVLGHAKLSGFRHRFIHHFLG